jgi:hypothetical protein
VSLSARLRQYFAQGQDQPAGRLNVWMLISLAFPSKNLSWVRTVGGTDFAVLMIVVVMWLERAKRWERLGRQA